MLALHPRESARVTVWFRLAAGSAPCGRVGCTLVFGLEAAKLNYSKIYQSSCWR